MAYIQKNNPFKNSPTKQIFPPTGETQVSKLTEDMRMHAQAQDIARAFAGGGVQRDLARAGAKDITRERIHHDTLPTGPKTLKERLNDLEYDINEGLGDPMGKAKDQAREMSDDPAVIDRFRHTLSAAYTGKKAGIIAANILGLAHETLSPNTRAEHKSDIINNAIGSIVGSIPFINEEQMANTIEWLNDRGWLSEYEKSGDESIYRPDRFKNKRK